MNSTVLRRDGRRVSRAPTALTARGTRSGNEMNYGAAGLAAGLAASAGLAAIAALPASAGAAAGAAASGGGAVSLDLLQAVTKNIENSARSRAIRIGFSLVGPGSVERA